MVSTLEAPRGLPARSWLLLGLDFSSAPSRRKPVTLAIGERVQGVVRLQTLLRLPTLEAVAQWLAAPTPAAPPRPWLGGFDLPFGLPRELVETLGWPRDWAACIDHYVAQDRRALRDTFAAFCAARPVGAKFAHRACDRPAGSSPSMKWVNPPVAWMLHAGVPLLRAAGWQLPAHEAGPPPTGDRRLDPAIGAPPAAAAGTNPPAPATAPLPRLALEAYPGLLARELIGPRSYKADDAARQTPERLIARKDMVDALEQGRSQRLDGLRLKLSAAQREALADDPTGDLLDATLCLMQAAWALQRPHWGLPDGIDPLEGWILSA
ncbi:MAG: hypothetical protein RIQ53_1953 [Pseudomonadota bacterium]|jgi:hypothetical protein